MNTAYFRADGACIGIIDGEGVEMEIPDAAHVVSVAADVSPNLIWCDENGIVHPKNKFEITVATNTISGIPVGTRAHLPNESVDIDDSTLELEVAMPTTMLVILEHPRYLTEQVEVPCEG